MLWLPSQGGGCTESYPVNVRTHATVPGGQSAPEATPVSQSIISLTWQPPKQPNGPNIRYELSKKLLRQPLDRKGTTKIIIFYLYQEINRKKKTF